MVQTRERSRLEVCGLWRRGVTRVARMRVLALKLYCRVSRARARVTRMIEPHVVLTVEGDPHKAEQKHALQ